MRALRWAGAILLGLVGLLLGLVGALLCVTILLAPLGIPILFVARKLFRTAGALVVPRQVRHPLQTTGDSGSSTVDDLGKRLRKGSKRLKRSARKTAKQAERKS